MKICILADSGSIHTVRWCRYFFEQGHDIHLISFNKSTIENIHTYHVDAGAINVAGGNWKVLFKRKEIKNIINRIRPDVVHSLYATSYGLVGALSGSHPYIVTPLGTDILKSPQKSFIYRLVLKYVFKKADLITSMASHMTTTLLDLGVRESKIASVMWGINTNIFNKKNRKLSATHFVITSTRNFEPVYNIPHFLKAIALVKDKIPNLKVIMIGSGSLKDELLMLANELKINNIVSFLGKVEQSKVVEVLNTSHVSVSVSLSDGNSLSLIEAMACGAYPIATDIPANREWIENGKNGVLVQIDDVDGLADCIIKAYTNFNSIIEPAMQVSDQIIAQKGTWQVNMQKMENLYRSCIK